jgi:putative endonuclease
MVDTLKKMAYCYILFSPSIDRFYIGSCQDLNLRYKNHLEKTYPNSYTSKANDWVIFYSLEVENITTAIRIEKHIKRMKSRRYIHELKESSELELSLKTKYSL